MPSGSPSSSMAPTRRCCVTIASSRPTLSGRLGAATARPRRSVLRDDDVEPDEAVDVLECAPLRRQRLRNDRAALVAAYEAVDAAVRARLHDERASVLEATAGASARLGAIPFHTSTAAIPTAPASGSFSSPSSRPC